MKSFYLFILIIFSFKNLKGEDFNYEENDFFFVNFTLNIENRNIDNALFTDYQKRFDNSYSLIFNSYSPSQSDVFSRNYFELNKSQLAITGGFGFKLYRTNFLYVSIESLSRRYFWYNYSFDFSNTKAFGSEWNDPLFLIHYIKRFDWSKHFGISLSAGIGFGLDFKSDYSKIFEKSSFTQEFYQGNPSYTYPKENFLIVTNMNYRSSIYPVASPKIQLNYRKGKHLQLQVFYGAYFSLFNQGGLNVKMIDIQNNQILKSSNYNFNSINTFFGIGFTHYWAR